MCYRLYAHREKVFQLVNATLQLGCAQGDPQLRGNVARALRMRREPAIIGLLNELATEPMMQAFLKRRNELTHQLMEHELKGLHGLQRLIDDQYEEDDIETHFDRDRWDLLSESMDVNAYRDRLVREFEDVTDKLDEFERGLCRELIDALSRQGLANK
jgi:hypothetical protein